MGNAARHGRREVGAIPPEVTPPTALTRGTEECGRSAAQGTLSTSANPPISFKKIAVAGLHRAGWIFALSGVDIRRFARLYNVIIRHAAASMRRRVFEAHQLILVTRHPISIGGHKLRRLSGSPGGGTALVPGCLTGESEERETWTAESLRAASRTRTCVFEGGGRTRLRRSTFQVNTLSRAGAGACDANRACWSRLDRSGTSSNVVIGWEKFSSNLRV